eukprot:12516-Pyramimonas_sp.AAC.2
MLLQLPRLLECGPGASRLGSYTNRSRRSLKNSRARAHSPSTRPVLAPDYTTLVYTSRQRREFVLPLVSRRPNIGRNGCSYRPVLTLRSGLDTDTWYPQTFGGRIEFSSGGVA